MKTKMLPVVVIAALTAQVRAQDTKVESWAWLSEDGKQQASLGARFDLEAYGYEAPFPGLVESDDDFFIQPRLTLSLNYDNNQKLSAFALVRADRGFDPGRESDGDVRADAYWARIAPWGPAFQLQVGKSATVFGNWASRHDAALNPFINAPLPYDNVANFSSVGIPADSAAFLKRRDAPDNRDTWSPIIWGPAYGHAVAALGTVGAFDYALDVRDTALSARPEMWEEPFNSSAPVFTTRLGWRPDEAWRLGVSASTGPYLEEDAKSSLPTGTARDDFDQTTWGADAEFSFRRLQIWAEVIGARIEAPGVGDLDTLAWYVEAKQKFGTRAFAGLRFGQQTFDELDGTDWARDLWRIEASLGYRFHKQIIGKIQAGHTEESGDSPNNDDLIALQFSCWL